jgi:Cell wall-active antibiotics response 4TMS YvqF
MNQRTLAGVIIGAVLLFLLVAAVVSGLVIGGVIGAVTDRGGGLQVRTEQPTSTDELRDSYDLETGSLEVNLEDLDLPQDTTDLEANVDTGALTVVVPRGVAVKADAEVGDGALSILGQDLTGENVQRDYESEDYDQAERRLSLNLSVGTGVISVVREQ